MGWQPPLVGEEYLCLTVGTPTVHWAQSLSASEEGISVSFLGTSDMVVGSPCRHGEKRLSTFSNFAYLSAFHSVPYVSNQPGRGLEKKNPGFGCAHPAECAHVDLHWLPANTQNPVEEGLSCTVVAADTPVASTWTTINAMASCASHSAP